MRVTVKSAIVGHRVNIVETVSEEVHLSAVGIHPKILETLHNAYLCNHKG